MSWIRPGGVWLAALLITACGEQAPPESGGDAPAPAAERGLPRFAVDPSWPAVPNDWVLGQVSSVTVDAQDQVWVLHRPRTVSEEQRGNAAPAVLAFDADGAFVRAWGGPGDGYDWPANEHGIHVDFRGHVWVGGNSGQPESDDMLLKFTPEGELLLQVGGRARSVGNADTENLRRPAEAFVFEDTDEVFVADGYGNRRVIVLNATTGAFTRLWGAFGNTPLDAPPEDEEDDGQGPSQFGTVHGIEVSADGLVYVADREQRSYPDLQDRRDLREAGVHRPGRRERLDRGWAGVLARPRAAVHVCGGPGQLTHSRGRPSDARGPRRVWQRR